MKSKGKKHSLAVKRGIRKKREAGLRHCHHPGYGLKWVGHKGRQRLAPDRHELQTLALVQEWRAQRLSIEAIYYRLRDLKILTRKGTEWSRDRISRALKAADLAAATAVANGKFVFRENRGVGT
jgi:hypothetical protein